jgi:hypothetical protein
MENPRECCNIDRAELVTGHHSLSSRKFILLYVSEDAEFLDKIQTRVLRVFLVAIQLCLEIYISSNSHNLLQFLHFSYCTL